MGEHLCQGQFYLTRAQTLAGTGWCQERLLELRLSSAGCTWPISVISQEHGRRMMYNVQCLISIFTNIISMSNCDRLRVGFGTHFPTYSPPRAFFSRSRVSCKGNISCLGCPFGSIQLIPWFLSVRFLFLYFLNSESSPRTLHGVVLTRTGQRAAGCQLSAVCS